MAKIIFDSEKELEDFVCKKIDKDGVCPISGNQVDIYWRQLNLGTYGIADIVKVEVCLNDIDITILELKKEIIDQSAIAQVVRYSEGVKNFIKEQYSQYANIRISAELAAPTLDMDKDTVFLINAIEYLTAYTIYFDLKEGFSSDYHYGDFRNTVQKFSHLRENAKDIKKLSINSFKMLRESKNSTIIPINIKEL